MAKETIREQKKGTGQPQSQNKRTPGMSMHSGHHVPWP